MVDDITRASMVALLARWQVAWANRELQKAVRDEVVKKIAENSKIIEDCKVTAKLLGFDRDNAETWGESIRDFVAPAQDLYARAKTPEMAAWDYAINPQKLEANEKPKDADDIEKKARPSIRQIVLDQLTHVGEAGAKAADIRNYIEETYAEEIHEKTVGMTLYRLLKDEAVRRKGHTWFLVPQNNAETKNPGGETPGLIEMLK